LEPLANWTSIANVNIYGNLECATTTHLDQNSLNDQGVTIFPVPVSDGLLSIQSISKPIYAIDIFNTAGQQVLSANGNGTDKKQIDLPSLSAGIYFFKLEGIGQGRLVIL